MRKSYGFTLLEILIVVVIIGILAGLAIPKFNKSIESAKGKEAYVNLELIRTANRMYYLDNNDYANTLTQLINANYLTESPNTNPNRNWQYYVVGSTDTYLASRLGGQFNALGIVMDINGNLITNWPWPPNP